MAGRLRGLAHHVDAKQQWHRSTAFPLAIFRKFADDGGGSVAARIA